MGGKGGGGGGGGFWGGGGGGKEGKDVWKKVRLVLIGLAVVRLHI